MKKSDEEEEDDEAEGQEGNDEEGVDAEGVESAENKDTSKGEGVAGEDEDAVGTESGDAPKENGKKTTTVKKEKVDDGQEGDGDKGESAEVTGEAIKKEPVDGEDTVAAGEEGTAEGVKTEKTPVKKAVGKDGKTVSPIRFKSNFIKLACPHCPKAVTNTFKVSYYKCPYDHSCNCYCPLPGLHPSPVQ